MAQLAIIERFPISERDVEIAWATYRALLLAEVNDPCLQQDLAHLDAVDRAQESFARLYDEWSRR
jgi:hypothetical protein